MSKACLVPAAWHQPRTSANELLRLFTHRRTRSDKIINDGSKALEVDRKRRSPNICRDVVLQIINLDRSKPSIQLVGCVFEAQPWDRLLPRYELFSRLSFNRGWKRRSSCFYDILEADGDLELTRIVHAITNKTFWVFRSHLQLVDTGTAKARITSVMCSTSHYACRTFYGFFREHLRFEYEHQRTWFCHTKRQLLADKHCETRVWSKQSKNHGDHRWR